MSISDRIREKIPELTAEIEETTGQLENMPPGKLVYYRNGKYHKYFQIMPDGTRHYIPKSDISLAFALARKACLTGHLKDLQKEKAASEAYLKVFDSRKQRAESFIKSPAYQTLLNTYDPNTIIREWKASSFAANPKHPEQLNIKTSQGTFVRSKSEALIAESLLKHEIPFRYEAGLDLGNITLYPDFTILHPNTLKICLWEHFGMVDNYHYRQSVFQKLGLYIQNGFIPNDDLILTWETDSVPLSPAYIEEMISYYFH